MKGITATVADSEVSAAEAGLHMLLAEEELFGANAQVSCYTMAYSEIKVISGDPYSLQTVNLSNDGSENTFGIPIPEQGSVTMLYPRTEYGNYPVRYQPRFSPDQTVFISCHNNALSKQPLEQQVIGSDHTGLSLTVNRAITVNDILSFLSHTGETVLIAQRLHEELMVLNPEDFKVLTGIDSPANAAQGIATEAVTLSQVGCYIATRWHCADETIPAMKHRLCATNHFSLAVGDDSAFSRYGLPEDIRLPEEGEVTLVLSNAGRLSEQLEKLRLSGVTRLELDPSDPNDLFLDQNDRLELAIRQQVQHYTDYKVCSVVYSDGITTDLLLLTEEDLAALCGRTGAYTRVFVDVDSRMELSSLSDQLTSLYSYVQTAGVNGVLPSLTESGEIWETLLVSNCRYDPVLRILSVLLLLSIPFIWFSQQYNHYKKRKNDLRVLLALGQPRIRVLQLLIGEGVLLALINTAAILIICPAFTAIAYGFLWFNGFPFAYTSFDLPALFAVILCSALCAIASSVLAYCSLFSKPQDGKA